MTGSSSSAEPPLFITPEAPAVPIPESGIHSHTVRRHDGQTVVGFGMALGEEMSEHTSSRAAVVIVTSGRIEVRAADRTEILGPGGAVAMAPGTLHALRAVTPAAMTLVLGAAPAPA